MTMHRIITSLLVLAGLGAAGPADALTIRLLSSAVVDGGAVRLGNIATIANADRATAERLANVVVVKQMDAATATIQADAVLFAVLTQDGRELAGQLGFAGAATCTVSRAPVDDAAPAPSAPAVAPTLVMPSAATANRPVTLTPAGGVAAPGEVPAADSAPAETLSSRVQRDVLEQLGARAADVRFTIATRSNWLDQPVAANQLWQIRPLVRSFLGTVQYQAQLLDGTRVVQIQLVQMRVELRTRVLVAAGRIERNQVVRRGDVREDTQWMDRVVPTLITDPATVIDEAATRDIPAGMVLDQRDFKTVQLIARGDKVTVYFTASGLRIKITALALAAAARHERVALRNDATGEELTATVIGKNLAVVGPTLSDAQEQALLEAQ